jgi:hypothetical protein
MLVTTFFHSFGTIEFDALAIQQFPRSGSDTCQAARGAWQLTGTMNNRRKFKSQTSVNMDR